MFYVLLTAHLDYLCNENQLDALFILNLFHHSTSTCFGHMLPIIRRYILYMYSNWYVLYVRLTDSWPGQDGNRPAASLNTVYFN
jgi:hypothetical protein